MNLKIGVATIGNEVVKGRTADTNFTYIADFFTKRGKVVEFHVSCRDELLSIEKTLDFLKANCEIIITTGGLGPTMDDITIASIARHFHKDLFINPKAEEELRLKYKTLGLDFTSERKKMVEFPEGSEPIINHVGSAPGMLLRVGQTTIFSLPGVPNEMKAMLPEVYELIGSNYERYMTREFEVEGIMESSLAPVITDIYTKLNNNIYIKSHPMPITKGVSRLILEIYGYGNDESALSAQMGRTYNELRNSIKTIFHKDI